VSRSRQGILSFLFLWTVLWGGVGCYSLTTGFTGMDPNMVASLDDRSLCIAYEGATRHGFITQHIVAEINRRGLLSEEEWIFVNRGNLYQGMRLCGVYAAWGAPENQVVFKDAFKSKPDRLQLMYKLWANARKMTVIVEDDLIESWSNY